MANQFHEDLRLLKQLYPGETRSQLCQRRKTIVSNGRTVSDFVENLRRDTGNEDREHERSINAQIDALQKRQGERVRTVTDLIEMAGELVEAAGTKERALRAIEVYSELLTPEDLTA